MRFARRTVIQWCCCMQRTFTKHSDAWCMPVEAEQNLGNCRTYTEKESWRTPERYPHTMIIIGVIGVDLWSIHLSHPEQVGGCRWTTVEYHKHHAFPTDSRPNCWKPHHLLWGWPCQLRCTRNVFRMGARTKADQEELQCHHPELTENRRNYQTQWYNMPCLVLGRFCSRCELS